MCEIALEELIDCAKSLGADAVVAVDIDYEVLDERNSMLMVSVSGTAVKLSARVHAYKPVGLRKDLLWRCDIGPFSDHFRRFPPPVYNPRDWKTDIKAKCFQTVGVALPPTVLQIKEGAAT